MDKTIKNKLYKKFSKELQEALAELEFLKIKIEALSKIVKAIESTEEAKE